MARTIGHVPKGASNRYWHFTLPPATSRAKIPLRYAFWFAHVCIIFTYSLFLSVFVRMQYAKSIERHPLSRHVKDFIDIYPTCVYPLMVKSMELDYFRRQKLMEPSLELGTGDGYFTNKVYAGRGEKLTFATDLIGHTLIQATRYGFWQHLVISDATHIPLPDNSMNTVIMNNLIHHLPDRGEVLDEVHRVLRPNGLYILTDELVGWATSQWHVKAHKRDGEYLASFLHNSVQCLLENADFWRSLKGWEICEVRQFMSNRAMYWSSYLESMNKKLGSPTPEPIRQILNALPPLKWAQTRLIKGIAERLIDNDADMCAKHGATSVFVVLRKTGNGHPNDIHLVCPSCHGELRELRCVRCNRDYPQFQGIPFLVPYADELTNKRCDDGIPPEVSC